MLIIVISLHFLRVCFAKFLKIPELKYDWVYRLAREYPDLQFSLNGGVKTLEDAINLLNPDLHDGIQLNSVMIGRAAWHNPRGEGGGGEGRGRRRRRRGG